MMRLLRECYAVSIKQRLVCFCLIVGWLPAALAADVYYHVPVSALTLTEGQMPSNTVSVGGRHWRRIAAVQPYVVVDGGGQAFISGGNGDEPWNEDRNSAAEQMVSICVPENQAVTGRLFLVNSNLSGLVPLRFKVAPAMAKPEARAAFLTAKEKFYRDLFNRNLEGAAWFRYQIEAVTKEGGTNQRSRDNGWQMNRNRPTELEDTFELFTGGRALSENLQLDRAMAIRGGTNAGPVALTNLPGITVRAMDWKPLLTNSKTELDPLAAFIPADQHAVFFPSFQALSDMTEETDANGTPVLQLFEPRSEDAGARERYQQQLCLGLNDLSRLLGPQVIASAAFTGSDPFLRVGTDVAVVFEARNLSLLQTSIQARQAAARAANPAVKQVSGEIEGVRYAGVVSSDRAICSYVAAVSNVVLVANSRPQLEILVRTAKGKVTPLGSQDEYVYFRQRYPRNATNETAFLVLSDATIRRWCGPQWRIADSRRTRAAAVLANVQAGQVDALVRGKTAGVALGSDYSTPDLGALTLTAGGVTSAVYGSLNFMTPIAELPLTTVTSEEADAYARWRDSYQQNWSQFFDPIAVRFSVSQARLTAELTVMPLILNSRYKEFTAFTKGAQITPDAGDPHANALARLSIAVNNRSEPVQQAGNFVGNMAPGLKANFLSWLGQSICLYADDAPFWSELTAATNVDRFMEKSVARLPVGLYFEVKNSLAAAAFLVGVHAFADQSAPQMTVWENLEYHGRPYVRVSPSKLSRHADESDNWVVYYALTPDALTVTLNEDLLKRALDRQVSQSQANTPVAANSQPWLGSSLGLQVQKKFVDVLLKAMADDYQSHQQQLAWNNLPILNEWKRLYPDRDPVKLHEQLWGVKLLCPGGGTYVWNEAWQTMESSVFGHPGQPKTCAAFPFSNLTDLNLGVSFEDQGLSAKSVVNRSTTTAAKATGPKN